MNDDCLKLKNQLCFPIYACSREITRAYKPYLEKLNLTYTQYLVMMVLWEQKEVTVKSLGNSLCLDSGTLTPLLKKLENKGFAKRARAVDDERSLLVSLTNEGEKLKVKARTVPIAMGGCVDLSEDDVKQLRTILARILDNLGR
ncbi:Organic hydroperoxide resistance transcriptional regulator [bioreactor metagenome]|uniref:Organic hydroperoxide resistance transcriptional regulator n=1 Tax=bioreactor metagenome TaxID=1076179 RepID=A0A644VBU0_9ZZZZ|nr:MarR family transcriptional regulator [Acidaminococcaceae bacterium]NLU43368.1 MarR family transcriptional regulator [Acholeplasmataceae bacterium]